MKETSYFKCIYIYLHQFFHDCWRFMPHVSSCSFKLLLELGPSSMGYLCAEGRYTLFICQKEHSFWSNYSDLTQGTSPQKGKSNFKRKSRLVKLNLARLAGHTFGIAILESSLRWGYHFEVLVLHTWIFQVCKICAFSPKKPTKNINFTYMEDPGIDRYRHVPATNSLVRDGLNF